ncbi:MAG: hypothetical protein CL758_07710 [Chloroflexi bacterium]|nr:hypothetical protein [Chloroflexota bacterium]
MNKPTKTETAFKYPDFRLLWIATLFSSASAWALIVARGWLMYEITDGSSAWVAIVTFSAMIPRVLITPIFGYLSDKLDRKRFLAFMFAINIAHNIFLGILVTTDVSDHIKIGFLAVLAFINGSARAAQTSASESLLPNLIPKRLLLNGIAWNQAALHGSRLFGPAAIAPLLSLINLEWAFYLCSAFYVISLITSLRISTISSGVISKNLNFFGNFLAGLNYVYKNQLLLVVVFLTFFHCGLTMSFESLLPVLSEENFGTEGKGFSYLMMGVGAGSLVSVITISFITKLKINGYIFFIFGLLSAIGPILLVQSTNINYAIFSSFIMGMSQAGFMTLAHTIIQSNTLDEVRGRVGAIYSVHVGGIMATANLFNGFLDKSLGAVNLLLWGGIIFIIIMLLSVKELNLKKLYFGKW